MASGAPWSPEEVAQLTELLAAGHSRGECARIMGRPLGGVRGTMLRHGLTSTARGGDPATLARRANSDRECLFVHSDSYSEPYVSYGRMDDAKRNSAANPAPRAASSSGPGLYSGGPGASPGRGAVAPNDGVARDVQQDSERIAAERQLDRLRRQLSDERRRRWAAEDAAERALKASGLAEALSSAGVELPPIKAPTTGKSRTAVAPVMMLSDLHVEERVRNETVNGLNEYDPDIAEQRCAYLFEGWAWHIEKLAAFYRVDEAVLWLGGDLVSGLIHEEMIANNAMMTPPAVMLAQELIARGIDYLLERLPFIRRLRVVCSFGNHGRVTRKVWRSIRPETSYEWIIYAGLQGRFSGDGRTEWQIAGGELTFADVYGLTLRFTHGDSVGYQGGIGGLTIPLKKKCLAWDRARPADVTVLGHFHQCRDHGFAAVNGSVVGWNPYAISIGADYEPPRQGLMLINAEFGRQTFTHVYCDPSRKAGRRSA